MWRAAICQTIDPPWASLEPIVLGRAPLGRGTPSRYVLVEGDNGSKTRCDVYASPDAEYFFREGVWAWHDLVVVGFGEKVYCVNLRSRTTFIHDAAPYFSSVEIGDDFCLVASGEKVLRLREEGSLLWRSQPVAIDGIVISDVAEGVISGQGEWDPPGGWRDFKIDFASGQVLGQ